MAKIAIVYPLAGVSDGVKPTHDSVVSMTNQAGLPIIGLNFAHKFICSVLAQSEATESRAARIVTIRFAKSGCLADDASVDANLDGSQLQPLITETGCESCVKNLSGRRIRFPLLSVNGIRSHNDPQGER